MVFDMQVFGTLNCLPYSLPAKIFRKIIDYFWQPLERSNQIEFIIKNLFCDCKIFTA